MRSNRIRFRRRIGLALASSLLGSSMGCANEVAVTSWQAIDYEALRDELESPSGPLDEEQAYRVAMLARQSVEIAVVVGYIIVELERLFDGVQRKGGIDTGRRSGTNVFVRLSCPGIDPTRAVSDFSAGEIIVEAPVELDLDDLKVDVPGDALVKLRACQLGAWRGEGDSAAYLDPLARNIGLDATFDLEGPAGGGLGFPVLAESDRLGWQVFVDGESYSIYLDRDDPRNFEIRGVDEAWRCSLAVSQDVCQPL